jgi:Family of unknown function (DUF5977)
MRVKLFWTIFSLSLCTLQTNGQNALPNIMSPGVATLGKYGTYNINYYTGTPNISIPLHDISENGIQVPISLSYDASGFIPNKSSGQVGLNWTLMAGGAITRVVNSVPDEKYNPNPSLGEQLTHTDKGYIYGQLNAGLASYTSEYIRKLDFLNYAVPLNNPPLNGLAYEYSPDIFSFNFLGHSGKFFLDNTGTVRVCSDRRYKVDLTEFKTLYDFQNVITVNNGDLNTYVVSRIKIISDDGYQFTFGGALNTVELNFSYPDASAKAVDPLSGKINAWYLTKVLTPDGNEITFNYETYTNDNIVALTNIFTAAPGNWDQKDAGFMDIKLFWNHSINITDENGNVATSNTRDVLYKSLIKVCYLKEIKSKLQTVSFNYSQTDATKKFYGTSVAANALTFFDKNLKYYTKKLDQIQITDNLNTSAPFGNGHIQFFPITKAINFAYDFNGNSLTGYRMFLKDVSVNNTAKYVVNYDPGQLPDPLTRGVDIWGFYNGMNGNTDLIGDPMIASGTPGEYETNFVFNANDRLAKTNVLSVGLLKSITYPTGGLTEFTFENHTYSKSLKRKVSSGITPVLVTETGTAGGVRIKEIKNTPGTTSTFKYIENYDVNPAGTVSSGLLNNNGVYLLYLIHPALHKHAEASDNDISAGATYNEPHIGYKEVVEIKDGGYTKYSFSNHETNPDTYYLGEDSYRQNTENSTTNFNSQLKRLYKYSSREFERGKLLKSDIFNASNTLLKSTAYTYNTDLLRTNERTIGFSFAYLFQFPTLRIFSGGSSYPYPWYGLYQSYALYYYHDNITSVTEKDYSSNAVNPLTKTTAYLYKSNTNPLLTEKTVTQSDGSVFKYKYKYPEDFPAVSPYQNMYDKFMISSVIEETIQKSNDVLAVNKYNYGLFNSNTNIKLQNEKTVNQKLLANTDIDLATYTKYSTDGKILEANKTGDYVHSYLWGYQNVFPVAEAKNALSSDIAYSSFEANESGNWIYSQTGVLPDVTSPTGKKCYKLSSGLVQRAALNTAQKYIVSYWYKGTSSVSVTGGTQTNIKTAPEKNGWTYTEREITGTLQIDIGGTGYIDELRLYPVNAYLTTYTYEPLVGMTSMCDINNKISYFGYDGLGRLLLIRDQDKNIIKKICYGFTGQPENCTIFYNVVKSGAFTSVCGPGYTSSAVTYTVPANTYISLNSQQEADQYALTDVANNGQAYANANGCIQSNIYARTSYTDYFYDVTQIYAVVLINFYSDAACTIPVSVNNLTVNYLKYKYTCNIGTSSTSHSVTGSGTQISLGSQMLVWDDGATHCFEYTFQTTAGVGYIPIPL